MCATDETAFRRTISDRPADQAPRLIFADWLDDHDRSEEATTIRSEVAAETRKIVRQNQQRERASKLLEAFRDEYDLQWSHAYAEPGYADPETGMIVFGNWNNRTAYDRETNERTVTDNRPERLGNILEKLGCDLQWSDEWATCGGCGKAVRTQPDSWGWTPSYNEKMLQAGEFVCLTCEPETTDDSEDDETEGDTDD